MGHELQDDSRRAGKKFRSGLGFFSLHSSKETTCICIRRLPKNIIPSLQLSQELKFVTGLGKPGGQRGEKSLWRSWGELLSSCGDGAPKDPASAVLPLGCSGLTVYYQKAKTEVQKQRSKRRRNN